MAGWNDGWMNRHRPRAVANRVSAPAPRRRRARIFSHRTPPRALAPALALARAPRASSSPARPPAGSERPRARGRPVARAIDRSCDRATLESSIIDRARTSRRRSRASPAFEIRSRDRENLFRRRGSAFLFFFRAARISRISPRSTYCAFEKRRIARRASRGRRRGTTRSRDRISRRARVFRGTSTRAISDGFSYVGASRVRDATRRARVRDASRRAMLPGAPVAGGARVADDVDVDGADGPATTATMDARRARDRRRGRRTTRTIRRRRSRRTSRETSCSREASAREDGNRCGRA